MARLAHELPVAPGRVATAADLVRIARVSGLKARRGRSSVKRLGWRPLAVIARRPDGGFFVIDKAGKRSALVADGISPPPERSLQRLDTEWSGEIISVTKREAPGGALDSREHPNLEPPAPPRHSDL